MINDHLAIVAAFLFGSIPFGFFVAKLWGIEDVRKVGSTNIGATNVVRAAGWKAGALTFFLDFLKGFVPMYFLACNGSFCGPHNVWIGLASVIGHCFTPFMKFKGGKGVSTTFGFLLALNWKIGLLSLLAYGITLALLKISALGSLAAMLIGLLSVMLFQDNVPEKLAMILIFLIVIYRHKANWEGLLNKAAAVFIIAGALLLQPSTSKAAELKDFRGKSLNISQPKRIVTLMPALGEAVIDFGEANRLIGTVSSTNIPDTLKKKIKIVGPYHKLSVESIYELHPDLVLASMDGNEPQVITQLESLHVPVFVFNSTSLHDVLTSLDFLAEILGKKDFSKVRILKKEIQSLKTHKPKYDRIFIQVGWNPVVTVGKNTFIHELITLFGEENIYSESTIKYPKPSVEDVLSRKPNIILLCPMTQNTEDENQSKKLWLSISSQKIEVKTIPLDLLTKPNFALILGIQRLKEIL